MRKASSPERDAFGRRRPSTDRHEEKKGEEKRRDEETPREADRKDEGDRRPERREERKGDERRVVREDRSIARREEDKKPKEEERKPVDREKTCPLLLRVFYREGQHNPPQDFRGNRLPVDELQIYTWMDATFGELATLMQQGKPSIARKGTKLNFATMTPDNRGTITVHDLADVVVGAPASSGERNDANVQLRDVRFKIGDFVDVSITHTGGNGRRSSRGGRFRRN